MKKIILLVCIQLFVINEAIGALIHSPCKSDNSYCRRNSQCCSNICDYSRYYDWKICIESREQNKTNVEIVHISMVTENSNIVNNCILTRGVCLRHGDCCSKYCDFAVPSFPGRCSNKLKKV